MHSYDFDHQKINLDEITAISNALQEKDLTELTVQKQNLNETNKFRDTRLAKKIAKLDEVLAKIK